MKYLLVALIVTAWWTGARCVISRSTETVSVETPQHDRPGWGFSCSTIPRGDMSTESLRDSASRDKTEFSIRSANIDRTVCLGKTIGDRILSRELHEDSGHFRHMIRSLTFEVKSIWIRCTRRKRNFDTSGAVTKAFRKIYDEISDEFQINTSTDGENYKPIIAIFEDDTGAVFWSNSDSAIGIRGQLFDIEWNKVGAEFEVSTSTVESLYYTAAIAILANGSYAVCWTSMDKKIYARIFYRNISQGPEFQVNSSINDAIYPDILALDNGGFVVVWSYYINSQYDIYTRFFDQEGETVGDEFLATISRSGYQKWPRIARLSNGNFVLAWQGGVGTDSQDILVEIFDQEWNSVANEFVINTYTVDDQRYPQVTALNDGGFVVAWNSYLQDGNDNGVFAQRFDSSGNKIGDELQVNQHSQGNQQIDSAIALRDGGFLISFIDYSGNYIDGKGVFARRYDQNGNPTADEFQVNQYSDSGQDDSNLAATGCGFVVVWTSEYPTASDKNIFGRIYYDSIPSPAPSLINPITDFNLFQFKAFSFVVPADTFYSSSRDTLNYSARIFIDGERVLMESFWLTFDKNSRAFSGTPTLQQTVTVQLEASEAPGICAYKAIDEFQITVAPNSKPVVNALIPNQAIPFSRKEIWEYYIPKNAFKDLEGDPIIYTSAVSVINDEEKDLDILWESLDFDIHDGELSGIPNLSGNFTIRVYADDGLGDLNPTALDMTFEIISQGIELLELYRIDQRGFKGFISADNSSFWVAEGSELKRFNLSSENPLLVAPSSLQYSFNSSITALAPLSDNRMIAGDEQGNLALLSSSESSLISIILVKGQVTDIYNDDDEYIYVSHGSSLSTVGLTAQTLELLQSNSVPEPITSITKTGDIIYAGTQNGLFLVDTLTNTSDDSSISDVGYVLDLQIFETYLYILGENELLIFDVSNPRVILRVNTRSLEGLGTSLIVSKIDGDVIVFISEGENGVSLINASDLLNLSSEGYYSSISSVYLFCVSSKGTWGLVLKESEVLTVEIFRRKILLELCDSNSDPCSQELEIQAQKNYSKDLKVSELLPTFKTDFIYGLSYSYTVLKVSGSVYSSAPEWLSSSKVDNKLFKLFGQVPEYLIGSVVDLEVQAFAFESDGEKLLTLRKLVSLSIVPRHASVGSSIPDQSLEIGEEWIFSFGESVFPDADYFECEYFIDSEWKKSYDVSFIHFTPSSRKWYISDLDSIKENFFGCNPCSNNTEYSTIYEIIVRAKNSASDTDPGVYTTFNLYIYSGKIPDQQTHPGISRSIYLEDSIFPPGIQYKVSLLDSNDEAQDLPWWMSYISEGRKILMFPSVYEIGQDFVIQISGNNNATEFASKFTIKVRNNAPIADKQLQNQRVKLGEKLEYSFPSDTFVDSDEDSLSYSVKWHKQDGTLTPAIPSWITFNEKSLTFYGSPSVQGSYTLLVSASDGLGGQASTEFVIEAYNSVPILNPDSSFRGQIDHHIGLTLSLNLPFNLFMDSDGDILSYSALQSDGSELPSWLMFNPSTLFFSGTPSASNLIDTSLTIRVSATDGYNDAHTDFLLSISNSPPFLSNSLNSQIIHSLDIGFFKFKPGVPFEYTISRDTFTDSDNDALTFSSRLSNGEALPQWLSFDPFHQQFFGTPLQAENLSVSVTVSDGYASASDTFEMRITNQPPILNKSLQSQVDLLYPDPLAVGFYFFFPFSEATFKDEDDSLSYSALFSENGGEWRNLDFTWVELEGNTLFGTVSTTSTSNTTLSVKITASDGQQSVSDVFSLTILTPFPSPFADRIRIESMKRSIEVEVSTNGPKIAVFSYGTLSVLDISNNNKTNWSIEGSPSDINYVLERVKYRPSSDRLLSESKVFLRINGLEQNYSLSVFAPRGPIESLSIPNQKAYIDNTFSIGMKKYFNYSDESELVYSFEIDKNPKGYKNWLNFEESGLSGTPTESGETGYYKLRVTVTDEFDESASESFDLEVDYTLFQKLITLIVFLFEISSPVLTLLGLFFYRAAVWNLLTKHRKLYAPFQLRETEDNIRELLILRPDEEKMALKIFKRLKNKENRDREDLISDMSSIIGEMNIKKSKKTRKVIYVEKKSHKHETDNILEHNLQEDVPIVKIKGAEYHARFLFFCIRDRILKQKLSRSQQKELDNLVKEFKQKQLGLLPKSENASRNSLRDLEWTKCKDSWTIGMPDLSNSLDSTCEEITNFLNNKKNRAKEIDMDIFKNRIRIEQWKDRAVRIDHKSSLKEWELYQKRTLCYILPWKKQIENWVDGDSFSIRICRKNELVMKLDLQENPISEKLYVRVFDRTGYLICIMMILPPPLPDHSNKRDPEENSKTYSEGLSILEPSIINSES